MSDHLGELATALVDGQLGHGDRERALAHLTRCPDCRTQVDSQRGLQNRLRALGEPVVPAGLTDRLLAMPTGPMGSTPLLAPGEPPQPATFRAGAPGRASRRADRTRPAAGRPVGRSRRRRAVMVGGSSVLLGLGLLVVGATSPAQPALVNPDTPRYVVEHVSTSTEVPLGDPGMTAVVSVSRQR